MNKDDTGFYWFHIPIFLLKIVRILTKTPSGQPKMIQLERWGRLITVSTDPVLGRVRLDIITLPLSGIEGSKLPPTEDYQPKLDLGIEE
ncbi:MAG: hypothetical protein H8E32_00405 [Nitrospinae bacterium]|nr:hypothetical protein [Nitrospinota bacterium]